VIELTNHIVTFIAVFASLSIINLLIKFIRALLSTPPKPFELERISLLYYGLCISFITTLIINSVT
jgi:hypothetical protein